MVHRHAEHIQVVLACLVINSFVGSLEHVPRLRKALELLDTSDQEMQTLEAKMHAILALIALETRWILPPCSSNTFYMPIFLSLPGGT